MNNRIFKALLLYGLAAGLFLWIGYSSRKSASGSGGRKFEPTAARLGAWPIHRRRVGHCFECHSEVEWEKLGGQPKPGRKGAGIEFTKYGMPWVVAPNITPDVETGAGAWTDEQFARAIREGIGHDGRRLFPIMPYKYFRAMSDEDLASVVVYLRSIEPVRNVLPKTSVPEPLKNALPELIPDAPGVMFALFTSPHGPLNDMPPANSR